MEISEFSIAISILVVTLVALAFRVVNWIWLRPKRLEKYLRNEGLSGNSYKLLYGDLKELSMKTKDAKFKPISLSDDILPHVLPLVHQSLQIHGKNSFIWVGPIPRVNISNPEDIRDVLVKFGDFQKPATNPIVKLLATGLANYEGDKWALHRKIINPAFHLQKLKLMLPAMYLSCSEMISKWEEMSSEKGWCELDVWPFLENFTRDVISRTAFGSSHEDGRQIFQIQKEQAELAIKAILTVYIPGWRFLPTKLNTRMKQNEKEVRCLIRGIIEKKQKAMKVEEGANNDLLGIMLESNSKEIEENKNKKNVGMSIDDVIEECKLFYFAGQETSSTLLVWTIVLLSKFPHWQKLARDEVLQTFGDKKPNYDGLNHLKIVTMILYEVLRLYPPVVVLNRRVAKATKLGNLTLPTGIQVSLPTILVHYDKQLWGEDANEFKPERFADGISKATKSQVSFFPFGWGPRICVGQNFALIEAKLALAMILQHFSFEFSPTYVHAPFPLITLQPQFGCNIILHKV